MTGVWQEAFAWACIHSLWQVGALLLLVKSFAGANTDRPHRQDRLLKFAMAGSIAGFVATFVLFLYAAANQAPATNIDPAV